MAQAVRAGQVQGGARGAHRQARTRARTWPAEGALLPTSAAQTTMAARSVKPAAARRRA